MSYFAIEREGAYKDHFTIKDNETDSIVFTNYLDMTYDEMSSQKDLEDFVCAIMDVVDSMEGNTDTDTILTLVDEDDIFIWSIITGYVNDELRYVLVDWKKDGKNYRYTP
jgi:hypothetical protein